ncbi:MAG TPA: IPT/TIG domain-containing protein [Terracidiphilus sp.]|nr:IPT/TIG domain-containing protein [Terracidiphilus sp.]
MASNSQNMYPIIANTVPADMLCVRNGQDVVNLVEQFCAVQGLAGNSGSNFPMQDTVGQQALQLAQQLNNQVQAILVQQLQHRESAAYAPVPTGTNAVEFPISWTSPMPGTGYLLYISLQNPSSTAALGAAFAWWIVAGSQTTTGCTIHFASPPAASANWKFAWQVIMPQNAANAAVTAITGFSPVTGTVGTLVSISGAGFTNATEVDFNGTSAGTFTVVTDGLITAVVPSGATTGVIDVVVGGVTYYSASTFTVT